MTVLTYSIPNLSAGIDDAIIDTAANLPIFIPMFLFFVFFTVFLGGITSQKKRTGNADMPLWATLASFSTLMVTLPLTITTGILPAGTDTISIFTIVVALTIASGIWLFMSRNRNEV